MENVVRINRSAAVVKGGRRFSFSALVVVGDGKGRVGIGYGKANGVPNAVEKGVKDARKHMFRIPLVDGTIPHPFKGEYRASAVIFEPASPGTGIIAGASVRAVCEAAGIRNILTKCHGSGNPLNVVKACEMALKSLRTRDQVERLRGVKLDPAAGTWRMKALKASEGGTPRAEKEAAVQ
ncbi:MAG: 30S ribosomal protein S5 [Planctomycetes bacterium]|nr:30S ribosomal protein S5 [Planctomycetota bacterium]